MTSASKRRTLLLACLASLSLGLLTLVAITLLGQPAVPAPLAVSFEGYTQNSNGDRVAKLNLTNHSKQTITNTIYPPQQFGSNGWPQELPTTSLALLHELSPQSSTNQSVRVSDAWARERIPIRFHSQATWLERTRGRLRAAVNARWLKRLLQPAGVRFVTVTASNFVFSEELPPIDMHKPAGGHEPHE